MVEPARVLVMLGFKILATAGTATVFEDAGVPVTRVNKVFEGRPHIVDLMKNGEVQLIFNTTEAVSRTWTAIRSAAPPWTCASRATRQPRPRAPQFCPCAGSMKERLNLWPCRPTLDGQLRGG